MAFSVLKRLFKKEPAPEPEAPSPLARRRQLTSFAEAEDVAGAPVSQEAAILSDAAFPPNLAPEPADPVAHPEIDADDFEDAEFQEDGPRNDYAQAVLGRLETAFDALQSGELSLATYRERLLAEQAAVELRIDELAPEAAGDALDTALAARESVRWCLDWADEQEMPE